MAPPAKSHGTRAIFPWGQNHDPGGWFICPECANQQFFFHMPKSDVFCVPCRLKFDKRVALLAPPPAD